MSAVRFREVLRLIREGFNDTEIARSCGCARATVQDYRGRFAGSGVTREQLAEYSDSELLAALGKKPHREKVAGPEVDWAHVATELKRPGVTLALLWQELISGEARSYSYSSFCRRFREWAGEHTVTLRQIHPPGEKCFVDFSGMVLEYLVLETGEIRKAEIFVGSLGSSNLTYVEATESQALPCWLGAHVRMFAYFGGITAAIVPDNLKSGVNKANFYEPELNRAYLEFAEHYGTAILPARADKPKDKAKVEKAVQDIQHWILAPLRDHVFHSVAEINAAIKPLLEAFNAREQREYKISRRELFNSLERAELKPLPALSFQIATWKHARVHIDYHVEVERHYYSVPYYLVRKEVDLRITENLVEVFFDGKRVAIHTRSNIPYRHATLFEHMPPDHQAIRSRSRESFISWSKGVGAETEVFVGMLFRSKPHMEQAFRAVLGLQRLGTTYGLVRLENACKRANHFGLTTQKSIHSILKASQDKLPLGADPVPESSPVLHSNLRGDTTFH